MMNVIHHEVIHMIHPGASREADQPHVFKCLSLVAPLGQTELRAHSSSTMERVWAISPEFALKDQTSHKWSVPSPALKIGTKPARLYPNGNSELSRAEAE